MWQNTDSQMIMLPKPKTGGDTSLEQILAGRRSTRNFSTRNLTLEQIAQLLWSAQGITGKNSFRTAPSAGALYPLLIYVVAGTNKGLDAGIYRYHPDGHTLSQLSSNDLRKGLHDAGLSQAAILKAPISFLITGIFKKTTVKYGQRGLQYVFMEAGHAAQNMLLQAEALGLGAVPIGAFQDKAIMRLLDLTTEEQPLYLIPVGHIIE